MRTLEKVEAMSYEALEAGIGAWPFESFPEYLDVLEAQTPQALHRKAALDALDLLQAENVGPEALDEAGDQVDPQPNGVDVPGGELELHAKLEVEHRAGADT